MSDFLTQMHILTESARHKSRNKKNKALNLEKTRLEGLSKKANLQGVRKYNPKTFEENIVIDLV